MSVHQSGAFAALATADGLDCTVGPGNWSVVHTPAAATQAQAIKAAGATGVRHVCTGVSGSIATAGTAQTPLEVRIKDGTTIIWSKKVSCPANSFAAIDCPVSLVGSEATSMTLEFAAAGVAASEQDLTLMGYDLAQR